ncbi:MAG: NAD(P)/FAD-dependent oxidoreductase [Lachnotalea sp.]
MMKDSMYDIVVIGSGPAGYAACIRATEYGLKTALIEKSEIGGTCLNRGCIPTKSLLSCAHKYTEMKKCLTNHQGLEGNLAEFNLKEAYEYKSSLVIDIQNDMKNQLLSRDVEIIYGEATVRIKGTVDVVENFVSSVSNAHRVLQAKHIIVATGTTPIVSSELKCDEEVRKKIMTTDDVLRSPQKYKKLCIIGAGVSGVEFADFFSRIGCQVILLEQEEHILSGFDKDIQILQKKLLKKQGVTVVTGANKIQITTVTGDEDSSHSNIEDTKEVFVMEYFIGGNKEKVICEAILATTGQSSSLESVIECENTSYFTVNDNWEVMKGTKESDDLCVLNGVYGIGDAATKPWLANKSMAEGTAIVEQIMLQLVNKTLSVIPNCVFTKPEIACCGITQAQADLAGQQYYISKVPVKYQGSNRIEGSTEGFVKLLVSQENKEILGAHLICEHASDIIGEFVLAMNHHLTVDQLYQTIYIHPGFSEIILEALKKVI